MNRKMCFGLFGMMVLVFYVLIVPSSAQAKTEIQWWHAHTGFLGERVNDIVTKFNASQGDYEVKAVYKGTYAEALTAAIAAYRAKTQPHLIQVFEVGTQTMLSSGAIYPVYQLMKDQGIPIDWEDFLSVVFNYYSKDGNLYSMPFNSSTVILYYNRTIFKKAGLDPSVPPKTYDEIEKAAKACVKSGATKIGFTTAWPSWTLVENAHAWHDQPFADQENGFKGMASQLKINGPFGVKMMTMLARWQQEGIYTYSGRASKGDQPIINGEAAVGLASTALVGTLAKTAKFEWGTGRMPRMAGYPQGNSIIGGASLWVMKGHKTEEYKGVAKFFEFLGKPEQQAWWHAQTGYLPISKSALKALPADHFQKNPDMWTAFNQIMSGKTTANSKGIRLGNFAAIRDSIEAEMENIVAGKKKPKEGLDDAVKNSVKVLKEFSSLYK
ncbi:MAG: sn-glycerol-3-phosphate ABC transporter substrate-binding protein UgpB [Deltaproteobacteria bacterium]|nr:sn-glycerol-3-phosphate ABC transporter substrate-binding protein UgpB [Deltaproteobacteria bacterium]